MHQISCPKPLIVVRVFTITFTRIGGLIKITVFNTGSIWVMSIEKLVAKLAATPFVRGALESQADLSAFQRKPSLKVVLGVSAIGFSYMIGWPLISLLAASAAYLERPVVILVGGPVAYGLSYLVFLLGMYLAGARYSWIFLRWLTRLAMRKLIEKYPGSVPPEP